MSRDKGPTDPIAFFNRQLLLFREDINASKWKEARARVRYWDAVLFRLWPNAVEYDPDLLSGVEYGTGNHPSDQGSTGRPR